MNKYLFTRQYETEETLVVEATNEKEAWEKFFAEDAKEVNKIKRFDINRTTKVKIIE